MENLLKQLEENIISAREAEVLKYVEEGLSQGLSPGEILDKGLIPGMDIVGQRMKTGEMFIPEVLRSAKTMQNALRVLQPHMQQGQSSGKGHIIIGTVAGDLHDIGKNLVVIMLEGGGFTVTDLGTDIKPNQFVEEVKNNKVDILGMSALLTTTMPKMKETLNALETAGLRQNLKVMIGGAPVSQKHADEIGADAFAANAAAAVEVVREMILS